MTLSELKMLDAKGQNFQPISLKSLAPLDLYNDQIRQQSYT